MTGMLLLWLGVGAGALYARYSDTPAWVTELLISTPLGQAPDSDRDRSRRTFLRGWAANLGGRHVRAQYGLVDVRDNGGEGIDVTLSGRTWDGEVLVHRTFRFDAPVSDVPDDARPAPQRV